MKSPRILRHFALATMIFTSCGMAAQLSPVQSGYADVNTQKVWYEVYGEGSPVVLLHGAYMTIALNWGEMIPELSKSHKVVAIELQGHGHTPDSDRPFDFAALANDVAGVIGFLDLGKTDVIGYSFGGTVAYEVAISHPELVNKLVIISSVYQYNGWQKGLHDILKTFKPEFLDDTPLKTMYEEVAPDPGHWHAFVQKFIDFDTQPFSLGKDKVSTIKSPVLLISGDNDGVDLAQLIETYQLLGGCVFGDMAGLPLSQLAILPASTHVGLMMQTQNLLHVITPFLN